MFGELTNNAFFGAYARVSILNENSGNMMDVGMYGNEHAPHTSGYQNHPEMGTNGYSYYQNHNHYHHLHHTHHLNAEPILAYAAHSNVVTPNTTPTSTSTSSNSSAMYHPHLYSPSAAEYGITTSSHSPTEQHSYFDGDTSSVHSFYNAQTPVSDAQQAASIGLPESHIISSDNGLSYTNLDYMYNHSHGGGNSAAYLHDDDKSAVTAHLSYSNNNAAHGIQSDGSDQAQQHSAGSPILATASPTAWHTHHHGHHHPGFLDGGSIPAGHQLGLATMGSLQTQLNSLSPGNGHLEAKQILVSF